MAFVKTAFDNLLALVFPSRCLICERSMHPTRHSPLCPEHERELTPVEPPVCGKCGRKLFGESVVEIVCSKCRSMRVGYDRGFSGYVYSGPMRELIHHFKYRKKRYLGSFLGKLMADYLGQYGEHLDCDAIIPVPLHWRRYLSRGFNQAADLAKPLSRQLRIPVLKRILKRVRYTRPQVSLSPKERKDNIKNAFRVKRRAKLAGKTLLLVDDVITTGATLNECARILKAAGAAEVIVLTLAHPSDVISPPEQDSAARGRLQA